MKNRKCRKKKINELIKTKGKALEIHINVETPTFAKHKTHKNAKLETI